MHKIKNFIRILTSMFSDSDWHSITNLGYLARH